MIHYVKGDLFSTNHQIIAHGVNCRGAFGAGVAGLMAEKYPKSKYRYLEKFYSENWHLGDVQLVKIDTNLYIANCATQDAYYPRNQVHADYLAIRQAMEKVKRFAQLKQFKIAMPKIGSGLAGGEWTIIENILNAVFEDYDITVYTL